MADDKLKTYVVTGIHPVLGHEPGAEFRAALSEEQERALIEARAIRVVKRKRRDG